MSFIVIVALAVGVFLYTRVPKETKQKTTGAPNGMVLGEDD